MKLTEMLTIVLARSTVVRGLWVGVIVGTALNMINQGDAIFSDAPLDLSKLLLTYLVPYLVSTAATILTHHDLKKDIED